MTYRSARENKSTGHDGTLQQPFDEYGEQMFQLGYELDSTGMRVEQEEAPFDMTSAPRTQDHQIPSSFETPRRTTSSPQATTRRQQKGSRAPSKVKGPSTPTSSPRSNKRYGKNKSNHVVSSKPRDLNAPQLSNTQTDISSAGTPNSQHEFSNKRSFSPLGYRTSETSSESPTSLRDSGMQQARIYPHSPTQSTDSSNRRGLRRAQGSSRPRRRDMIPLIDNWRRKNTPSLGSHVSDAMGIEFVPPKDEDIKAAMVSAASDVSEKMRGIVEVVLQQQATTGSGKINPFRASYPALRRMNLLPGLDEYRSAISSSVIGVSKNYLGDLSVPENHSAHIPENQNCSLWLMGLPTDVTYTALLRSIRRVGKIYATWINHASGKHRTAAAKVVLFDRKAAETLFKMIEDKSFLVQGTPIQARWNRIKVARFPRPEQSRAIRITGLAKLMDFDFFQTYFETLFTFQLDRRFEVPCSINDMISHEWHFGSLRCQAQHAKAIIERELQPTFSVQWACDPCQHP